MFIQDTEEMPHEKYLKGHMLVILLKIIYLKSIYRRYILGCLWLQV